MTISVDLICDLKPRQRPALQQNTFKFSREINRSWVCNLFLREQKAPVSVIVEITEFGTRENARGRHARWDRRVVWRHRQKLGSMHGLETQVETWKYAWSGGIGRSLELWKGLETQVTTWNCMWSGLETQVEIWDCGVVWRHRQNFGTVEESGK